MLKAAGQAPFGLKSHFEEWLSVAIFKTSVKIKEVHKRSFDFDEGGGVFAASPPGGGLSVLSGKKRPQKERSPWEDF